MLHFEGGGRDSPEGVILEMDDDGGGDASTSPRADLDHAEIMRKAKIKQATKGRHRCLSFWLCKSGL
jgi:hypothetical protein